MRTSGRAPDAPHAPLERHPCRVEPVAAQGSPLTLMAMDRESNALNALSSGGVGTGDPFRRSRPPESDWLADALAELAEVDDEIAEDNLPEVGAAAKAEAERIVRALAGRSPASPAPAVYPTQDAGIALHFKSPGQPGTVLVLLRDDRRADCHAYIGGRSRRAHYDTSSDLPDAFVLDQLCCLTPVGHGILRNERRA